MKLNKEYRRCRRAWKLQAWQEHLARFDAWLQRFKGAEMCMSPCFKQDIKERANRLDEASDTEKLFLSFMRVSSDEYCCKCTYYTEEKCLRGAWGVDEHGNVWSDNELYATKTCLTGLLKYYRDEVRNNAK